MKKTWLIAVFALTAAVTLWAQPGPQGVIPKHPVVQPNVLDYLVDPNQVVFSRTFSEWDAIWQQWAYSIPVSNHPLFDKGSCSVGQSGPVWFLGGKFCGNDEPNCSVTDVQRSCTVPRGKYLYLPVWNGEDSALEEDVAEHPGDIRYQQLGYLRAYEDPWGTGIPDVAYATIDGVSVPNLEKYKVQSVAFGFTMPHENYLAEVYPPPNNHFKAGSYFPAVDMGEYLMLRPLAPGPHVIKFGAHFPSGDWGFNVTYFLTVQ